MPRPPEEVEELPERPPHRQLRQRVLWKTSQVLVHSSASDPPDGDSRTIRLSPTVRTIHDSVVYTGFPQQPIHHSTSVTTARLLRLLHIGAPRPDL